MRLSSSFRRQVRIKANRASYKWGIEEKGKTVILKTRAVDQVFGWWPTRKTPGGNAIQMNPHMGDRCDLVYPALSLEFRACVGS